MGRRTYTRAQYNSVPNSIVDELYDTVEANKEDLDDPYQFLEMALRTIDNVSRAWKNEMSEAALDGLIEHEIEKLDEEFLE